MVLNVKLRMQSAERDTQISVQPTTLVHHSRCQTRGDRAHVRNQKVAHGLPQTSYPHWESPGRHHNQRAPPGHHHAAAPALPPAALGGADSAHEDNRDGSLAAGCD